MSKHLRAFGKALTIAAGPLGAPVEYILSFYDDELTEQREAELDEMIRKGQNLTIETLEQIFEARDEIKELREQSILGIKACIEILLQNRQLMSSPQALEEQLPFLISQHDDIIEETGFITHEVLTRELSKLYSTDPNLFLATIGSAGFPLETVPHSNAPKVIVFHFLTRCSALELNQQANIFGSLKRENPSSQPLQVVTSLLRERVSSQRGN